MNPDRLLAAAERVRDAVLGAETRAARDPYHPRTARARRAQLERQERELRAARASIAPRPWERPAGAGARLSSERRATARGSQHPPPSIAPNSLT
jgi:hypothetical protein